MGIKFRVWDKKEKKFIVNDDVKLYLTHDGFYGIGAVADEGVEVMQFTGLKDKNGKEIYEGDIVKFIFEGRKAVRYVGKIIFNSELGHFQIIFEGDNSCGVFKRDVEIIGNICESPELLGGRNETNK